MRGSINKWYYAVDKNSELAKPSVLTAPLNVFYLTKTKTRVPWCYDDILPTRIMSTELI